MRLVTLFFFFNDMKLFNNFFINLGRFPRMDKLQTLILDNCNILDVEKEAFADLTNLKELSLKWNNFKLVSSTMKTWLEKAIPEAWKVGLRNQKMLKI